MGSKEMIIVLVLNLGPDLVGQFGPEATELQARTRQNLMYFCLRTEPDPVLMDSADWVLDPGCWTGQEF